MRIIGLTGPTGAGKGKFSQIAVRAFGAEHIDTDKIARQVVEPGSAVFSDRRKLAALNGITHPLVTKEVEKRLADARKRQCPFAVIDAPLLFESGEDKLCDVTVGILADEQTRLLRILERDGIDREAAEKRLSAAKSNEYFRERCGYILENDSDQAVFEAQIRRFFEALSEQNL